MKKQILEIWKETPLMIKLTLVLFIVLSLCMVGCSLIWDKYPEDNVLEELVEIHIQNETGLDLDLSPFSPE